MEVRRRTRPMVCFVNVERVERIIYSIFHGFNLEWKTRTSAYLHKQLDGTKNVMPYMLQYKNAKAGDWSVFNLNFISASHRSSNRAVEWQA